MISTRNIVELGKLLDAQSSIGGSEAIDVSGFRHLALQISTSGNANLTLKVQASISNVAPDFSSAQSVGNMWDYVQLVDLENGAKLDGDIGFAPAGVDDFRLFEVNTNNIKWLRLDVTAYTAGNVTVEGVATND